MRTTSKSPIILKSSLDTGKSAPASTAIKPPIPKPVPASSATAIATAAASSPSAPVAPACDAKALSRMKKTAWYAAVCRIITTSMFEGQANRIQKSIEALDKVPYDDLRKDMVKATRAIRMSLKRAGAGMNLKATVVDNNRLLETFLRPSCQGCLDIEKLKAHHIKEGTAKDKLQRQMDKQAEISAKLKDEYEARISKLEHDHQTGLSKLKDEYEAGISKQAEDYAKLKAEYDSELELKVKSVTEQSGQVSTLSDTDVQTALKLLAEKQEARSNRISSRRDKLSVDSESDQDSDQTPSPTRSRKRKTSPTEESQEDSDDDSTKYETRMCHCSTPRAFKMPAVSSCLNNPPLAKERRKILNTMSKHISRFCRPDAQA